MLAYPRPTLLRKNVALQMRDQLTRVHRRPMETAEHILRMRLIALSPRLIVHFVDEAGAVVALVEGDGDEAAGGFASSVLTDARVLRVDEFGSERGHFGGGLEARVQEPETCYRRCGGGQLGETVDGAEDAGYGVCLGGDGGGGVVVVRGVEGVGCRRHYEGRSRDVAG